jgi:hypothetical protein
LYFQSFQLQALQMGFAYMCIKIGNLFNISITINTCYCNPFLDLKCKDHVWSHEWHQHYGQIYKKCY